MRLRSSIAVTPSWTPLGEAGLAAPQPQAHGGEMGPVAPVGVANPRHAELPHMTESGICGFRHAAPASPARQGNWTAWPTVAMADAPDCFASIAASHAPAFCRRSHAFVSPGPLDIIKRLRASSPAGQATDRARSCRLVPRLTRFYR
jgi:hypothetical protein